MQTWQKDVHGLGWLEGGRLDMTKSALVLFSGGQDSTVCLAWALERYDTVETIAFEYGQRHAVELSQRKVVLERIGTLKPDWAHRLGADHQLSLPEFASISDTALTREAEIVMQENGLPSTFVPGRNLVFFTYAAAVAYRRGISVLVGGMCETDYSGYPDCREATMQSLQTTLALGMDRSVRIETPLMFKTKAATWAMTDDIGGEALVDLVVEATHTCYLGDRTRQHPWGYGCGRCPACRLRAKGYDEWQAAGN